MVMCSIAVLFGQCGYFARLNLASEQVVQEKLEISHPVKARGPGEQLEQFWDFQKGHISDEGLHLRRKGEPVDSR